MKNKKILTFRLQSQSREVSFSAFLEFAIAFAEKGLLSKVSDAVVDYCLCVHHTCVRNVFVCVCVCVPCVCGLRVCLVCVASEIICVIHVYVPVKRM